MIGYNNYRHPNSSLGRPNGVNMHTSLLLMHTLIAKKRRMLYIDAIDQTVNSAHYLKSKYHRLYLFL